MALLLTIRATQLTAAKAATSTTVRLPSPQGTGLPTGTMVVRVFSPVSGAARYSQGAPVVVFAPGGTEAGTLAEPLTLATDTVRIAFLFPGGCDGPLCSDGLYDERGMRSIAALRDVVLYAAGTLTDAQGRTIDEVVDVSVLHDNVGLFGASNGGNVVVATAALHGDELSGHLRYVIQWESPVSSQVATVELGPVQLCPTQTLQVVNPRYSVPVGYGPLSLTVDYAQLAYDPTDSDQPLFWDGTGDGEYTLTDTVDGCPTPDLDGDGVLSTGEDFPIDAFLHDGRSFYSRRATQAMADQNVFSPTWPLSIATPAQTRDFWDLREAVRLYPTATQRLPGLEAMVLSSREDHKQIAPDRPHVHQAFDGWLSAGAWVQVNPSPSYVTEIAPSLTSNPHLPDNAPNTAPDDWAADDYVYPNDLGDVYWAAAAHQMTDRVHEGQGYHVYLPIILRQ
jgi:hypothetical protein